MRVWVNLHSAHRDRPVNGTAVFTNMRREKKDQSFLERHISAPYVENIFKNTRQGLLDSIIVRALSDDEQDCSYFEYAVSFKGLAYEWVAVQVEISCAGRETVQATYSVKSELLSTTGPIHLVCG